MAHILGHDRSQMLLLLETVDDVGPDHPMRFVAAPRERHPKSLDTQDLALLHPRRIPATDARTGPLNRLLRP